LQLRYDNVDLDALFLQQAEQCKPGRYVRIAVRDSGIGMPREVQEKIFEPFFTTKPTGQGTGLGLATVMGIIKELGGIVRFDSHPGRGTTFEVYIPACEQAATVHPQDSLDSSLDGGGRRVLVIDDEASIRETVRAVLSAHNFVVSTAANGPEAVAIYAQNPSAIDLTITDIVMPIMDGAATICAIRAIDPNARIIACTGMAEERQLDSVRGQIEALLKKPFTGRDLLHSMREVFANHSR
jgi:CheY-like chemotaxis protein